MNGKYHSIEDKQNAQNMGADPWEGGHTDLLDGKICFCRIYEINAEERTCSIKTYGSDVVVSDQDFQNVQWLSSYASPLGDEISAVPEPDSQAICVFAGGVPWIVGFFNPITLDSSTKIIDQEADGVDSQGGSAAQGKEKINIGDFIFRTAGRCRLALRRGGEIEIEATKLCKRTYFPAQNLINELSQNYEFATDGGTINWSHLTPESDLTVYRAEWRDGVDRTNIITEERGTVEQDSTLIHRYIVKQGIETTVDEAEAPPAPVYQKDIYNDGTSNFKVNEYAYVENILSDGTYTQGINKYSHYTNIKPTGEMVININSNYQHTVLPTGETFIDIGLEAELDPEADPIVAPEDSRTKGKFALNIKPTGETSLKINEKISMTIKDSGLMTIDSGPGKSKVIIDPAGKITLETETEVIIKTETVNMQASFIKLGKAVADTVPMGKLILAALNTFIDVFNVHTHLVPQSPGGVQNSQPVASPAATIGEDVLSSTVEVQK